MSLSVGMIGCGLMGRKRAAALGDDHVIGAYDLRLDAAEALVGEFGGTACATLDDLLALKPDVVVVATSHDQLAPNSVAALEAGSHVLVEKPAGIGVADVARIAAAAQAAGKVAKVGFNHRFHPAIAQAIETARSGRFGDVLFLRGRYGHGGRPGYDREWRADPKTGGGGEMTDQGMHLLDLSHWLLGELPLHSALLRTSFWDMPVEDNAAILLGVPGDHRAPWATLHVTWTEWKNMFSMEITCRTGKLVVEGLQGSYGPQKLTVYAMKPEMGPPDREVFEFDPVDVSWAAEWDSVRAAIASGEPAADLDSVRYCWELIEQAYAANGYPTPGGDA
ncbi:MAG TPA: Gfo/Idh/MocA family oxidoreductase [Baekduia sp.]|jgi:predicted dehydrogenase|nr:Gfo/Idh/MocA family oxidoreductase [Baekduia sp.]